MKTSTARVTYPGPLGERSVRAETLLSPNNTRDAGIVFIFCGQHVWKRISQQQGQIPTCGSSVFIFRVGLSLNVQLRTSCRVTSASERPLQVLWPSSSGDKSCYIFLAKTYKVFNHRNLCCSIWRSCFRHIFFIAVQTVPCKHAGTLAQS